MNTFPQHNLHILVSNRTVLYVVPILTHRIVKRCVLKGQEEIEIKIFTAPSRTLLSDTGYFFSLPVPGHEGDNDY